MNEDPMSNAYRKLMQELEPTRWETQVAHMSEPEFESYKRALNTAHERAKREPGPVPRTAPVAKSQHTRPPEAVSSDYGARLALARSFSDVAMHGAGNPADGTWAPLRRGAWARR